jgi:PQQ-like domain
VLISLLAELPPQQGARAEEYLRQVANDRGPQGKLTDDADERKKYRDAWAKWWRDNGSATQLVATTRTYGAGTLGYTLVVLPDMGQVVELGRDGKPRWTITGLSNVFDAQALPGDKVLIAELGRNRVTERNLKGEVLWEKAVNTPINCQRLANGNTFIAARGQLLEVDRDGKEVFSHVRVNQDVMAGQRLRDGQYVVLTYGWQYARLDAAGKEQKTGRIPSFPFTVNPCSIEVLPNDRVLVAQFNQNKVTEVDLNGKVLWEATVQMPMSVSRLPNGNTLVGSTNLQRVTELDRTGKAVWEFKDNMRAFRARRR